MPFDACLFTCLQPSCGMRWQQDVSDHLHAALYRCDVSCYCSIPIYAVQEEDVFETVRRRITVKVEPSVGAQLPQQVKEALHEGHNDENQPMDVDECDQAMEVDGSEVKHHAPSDTPAKRRKARCGPCAKCGTFGEPAITLTDVFCYVGKGKCCCVSQQAASVW